jgi:hypothetical protein
VIPSERGRGDMEGYFLNFAKKKAKNEVEAKFLEIYACRCI